MNLEILDKNPKTNGVLLVRSENFSEKKCFGDAFFFNFCFLCVSIELLKYII